MLSAIYVPVAQLDRVLDYESRGRGFESLLARQAKYLLNIVRQVFFCVLADKKQLCEEIDSGSPDTGYQTHNKRDISTTKKTGLSF